MIEITMDGELTMYNEELTAEQITVLAEIAQQIKVHMTCFRNQWPCSCRKCVREQVQ